MRSRTGCLTCKARKLKCDERRPSCRNCQKAKRECRPSDSIIFRHQQNASMNGSKLDSGGKADLPTFYSYKNTFSPDSVWLEIPKKVTFVAIENPYVADPLGLELSTDAALTRQLPAGLGLGLGPEAVYRSRSNETAARGLEALSAAAARDRGSFRHSQRSHHDMASTAITYMRQNLHQTPPMIPPYPRRQPSRLSGAPATTADSNNVGLSGESRETSGPVENCLQT